MMASLKRSRIFFLFILAVLSAAIILMISLQNGKTSSLDEVLADEASFNEPAVLPSINTGLESDDSLPIANPSTLDKDRESIIRSASSSSSSDGCRYYVATDGNDNNAGLSTITPFRTIQRGIDTINPGEVLCVRGGTYFEAISITQSGTPSQPITITAYPGEKPIIDGRAGVDGLNSGLPACAIQCDASRLAKVDPETGLGHVWEALVNITGTQIIFDGFEITRSMGRGVSVVAAEEVRIRNCAIHQSRHGAILVNSDAKHVIIEGCKIWWNGAFAPYSRGNSLSWPIALMARGENVVIRNNEVFNNWGEGLGAGRGARRVLIEGNIVYDNFALQIYVDHAQDVVINHNLVYFSDDPTFYRGGLPSECIAINNETAYAANFSKNILVINNLVRGCKYNFGLWVQGSQWGIQDLLVANNTFIEGYEGAIRIAEALDLPHQNVRFKNNIILQSSGSPLVFNSGIGINFSHNLWWPHEPDSILIGPNDFAGDPFLSLFGSIAAGALSPDYFSITSQQSPAIGNGLVDSDAVSLDYFGRPRGAKVDIGALEW
ncbi:MAG: right-handed parallel beta-helix repeat-containing protein [Chloroflexi bacterium]|nr:right-handed parallel beta-helix repeat-containing protein [Chloroflexota bacterium]